MSDDLRAENAELRRRLESCMQRGDMAIAENARLRADVYGLRTALEQQQRATEAERAARSRSDIIVLAARRLVAGPDSENYTRLAAEIDAHDQARKVRNE
jgi:regulator of replication initiation timing